MTMSIIIDQTHIAHVLTALRQQGVRCPLESAVGLCPGLTEEQVFLAVDYLTQSGQVCLTLDTSGNYWLQAS